MEGSRQRETPTWIRLTAKGIFAVSRQIWLTANMLLCRQRPSFSPLFPFSFHSFTFPLTRTLFFPRRRRHPLPPPPPAAAAASQPRARAGLPGRLPRRQAALYDSCDRRVHRANKLAGKHRRFSLLHPSPSSSSSSSSSGQQKPPLCDICQLEAPIDCVDGCPRRGANRDRRVQERRGFLFCKEDWAILCRECDVPVHTASEITRRHSRFLLTGVRLSSAPVDSPATSEQQDDQEQEEENAGSPCNADSACSGGAATAAASASDGSSISEYLTKTLPGWHVEDFLVGDASAWDVGACSDGTLVHLAHGKATVFAVSQKSGSRQRVPFCREPDAWLTANTAPLPWLTANLRTGPTNAKPKGMHGDGRLEM
ncbi:hypothetical protein HU200_029201 [Digitaria exilis]|uniref:B box-type domain-containing protein n=1 Tax=Digitaria exilis TaxID=1010633 RepID=A0A835BTZ0_9POAL|nr:hypothetical protein HU200_029201 [Digitaria exilis]